MSHKLTGCEVGAERAERRTIKGELKPLRNLLDCPFASAPFGEHRSKQHD